MRPTRIPILLLLPLLCPVWTAGSTAFAGGVALVGSVEIHGARALSNGEARALLGLSRGLPFDSSSAVVGLDALLARYREMGYLGASARLAAPGDTAAREVQVRVDIAEGARARLDHFDVLGAKELDWDALRPQLELRPGALFSQAAMERDVRRALEAYSEDGHPYAAVRPEEFSESPRGLSFRYVVEEGPAVRLDHFDVQGNAQTSAERVIRQAALRPGDPYRGSRVRHATWRLRSLGAFDQVDAGLLAGGGSGTLRYRVREGGTSTAQGALGYAAETHRMTGLFDLELQNLGGGRAASFRLDARGSGVTEYNVGLREPLVFSTPLTASVSLGQHLEDTLYTQTRANLGVSTEVVPYGLVTLAGEWEHVVSTAGPLLSDRAFKVRLGLDWDRRDDPLAPTRGFLVKLQSRVGSRTAIPRDGGAAVSAGQREDAVEGEGYLRMGISRVLAFQGSAQELRGGPHPAPAYQQYTLGGATSLRGYREQQFRGPVVGRISTEMRWLMTDPGGYTFLFVDAGFVRLERFGGEAGDAGVSGSGSAGGGGTIDAGGGRLAVTNLVRPSFGGGLRIPTRLGLLGIDYAWGESITPLGGKIHVSVRSRF